VYITIYYIGLDKYLIYTVMLNVYLDSYLKHLSLCEFVRSINNILSNHD